ncbi:MAG: hypothetical protein QF619_09225, partial [Candidatus Binatia bacterium]|nr:hypothetical protein [Candidatus Binatia bacterium]
RVSLAAIIQTLKELERTVAHVAIGNNAGQGLTHRRRRSASFAADPGFHHLRGEPTPTKGL